jgi:hypothetical protein
MAAGGGAALPLAVGSCVRGQPCCGSAAHLSLASSRPSSPTSPAPAPAPAAMGTAPFRAPAGFRLAAVAALLACSALVRTQALCRLLLQGWVHAARRGSRIALVRPWVFQDSELPGPIPTGHGNAPGARTHEIHDFARQGGIESLSLGFEIPTFFLSVCVRVRACVRVCD